jgi:hypothetical protein
VVLDGLETRDFGTGSKMASVDFLQLLQLTIVAFLYCFCFIIEKRDILFQVLFIFNDIGKPVQSPRSVTF